MPSPDIVNRTNYQLRSVERALDIMEAFSNDKPTLDLNTICERANLPKSTVFKILSVLESRDYVQRDGPSGQYRVGFRAFDVGNHYLSGVTVIAAAHPFLRELALRFPRSVAHLAILPPAETNIVYMDIVSTQAGMSRCSVGSRNHAHCTALGKCLLAGLPDAELAQRLEQIDLLRMTAHTVDDVQKLRSHLCLVRERGYAIDDEERLLGNLCVAVPVYDRRGVTVAAISTSHVKDVMTEDLSSIVDVMIQTGAKASRALGYVGFN